MHLTAVEARISEDTPPTRTRSAADLPVDVMAFLPPAGGYFRPPGGFLCPPRG